VISKTWANLTDGLRFLCYNAEKEFFFIPYPVITNEKNEFAYMLSLGMFNVISD
jgi:hypothetical protein